jgi:integrase
LERRGKDRWRVTISLGFNCATGQYDRYRETIRAATKTEASRKAEAIRNRVLGTSDADAGKMTVAAYISDYLENVAPLNVRSSTLRGYVGCAERYIYPSWLGGLLMLAVTPPAMERYYQEISKRGGRYGGPLSGKTVHNVHVIIHKAFARAATHGVIPFNPTNVTLPKQFKIREIIILEIDDLARLNALIHEMPDRPLAIAIAIALHTGLRRGEVLGLHWDDIDFERNQIKVSHPIHQLLGGKTEHGDPKTEKSARTVKMTADLRQMLLEY